MINYLTQRIQIGQNDYGQTLQFTIYNPDTGAVQDLTNFSTVTLAVQAANNSGVAWSHNMTISSPATSGNVTYNVQQNDFLQWGDYMAQIILTPSGSGGQIIIPMPGFRVMQQLPTAG